MSRSNSLTAESSTSASIHTLFTSVFSVFSLLGTSVIISRFLGVSGRGVYELIIAVVNLFVALLGFSLPSGVIYVVAKNRTNNARLLKNLLCFCLLQLFASGGILFALAITKTINIFIPSVEISFELMVVVALMVFSLSLNSFSRAIFVAYRQIAQANRYDLAVKAIYPLVLMLVFSVFHFQNYFVFSPEICLWIYVLIYMFAGLIAFLQIPKKLPLSDVKTSNFKDIISYSIPCYASNISQFLNYRLDVFFVAFFSKDLAEVGYYTLATSIAQLIWILPTAVATNILPRIASSELKDCQRNVQMVAQASRIVISLSSFALLPIIVISPYLIPLIYGAAFQSVVSLLYLLLPGVVLFCATKILASFVAGIGQPKVNLYASLVGLFVTILLDLLLIPKFGVSGASIASSLSYSVTTVVTVVWIKLNFDVKIRSMFIPSIIDFRFVLRVLKWS